MRIPTYEIASAFGLCSGRRKFSRGTPAEHPHASHPGENRGGFYRHSPFVVCLMDGIPHYPGIPIPFIGEVFNVLLYSSLRLFYFVYFIYLVYISTITSPSAITHLITYMSQRLAEKDQ